MQDQDWARDILEMVDIDEGVTQWGTSFYEASSVHQDAFGNSPRKMNLYEVADGVFYIRKMYPATH
jgi:hypothetical protein